MGLTLTRADTVDAVSGYYSIFRLQITVTASGGSDPKIFIFERSPTDPQANTYTDNFLTVASAVDMVDYPVDNPNLAGGIAFYRKATVVLDFRASSELEDTWNDICTRAQVLQAALVRITTLNTTATFTC